MATRRLSWKRPLRTSPRNDLTGLTRAILASRFPDDTGAARFRQLAFVHLVAVESMRGNRPTATSLSATAGSHKSQMDILAKILVSRGVIVKVPAPGLKGAATAKILSFSKDPIAALQKAHREATGKPIEL